MKLGDVIALSAVAGLLQVDRLIDTGWVHCSASDRPEHDSVLVMDRWHREKGWSECGYQAFIRKDGVIQHGRGWHRNPAAQEGHNANGLAVCVHGLAVELFTAAQFAALDAFSKAVDVAAAARRGKPLLWRGHREVAPKSCPVFDYRAVLGLNAAGLRAVPPSAPVASAPSWIHTPQTLRLCDRGAEVMAVQQVLCTLGAYLVVDGKFGRATDAAVRNFQRHAHLEVDGIVGPLTLAALAAAEGAR